MRTLEKDLGALSIGLHAARRRTQDREQWRKTVEAAILQQGPALDDDKSRLFGLYAEFNNVTCGNKPILWCQGDVLIR